MAVEARHLDVFPSRLITHRDFIRTNQENNTQMKMMDSFVPFIETTTTTTMAPHEQILSFYQTTAFNCNNNPLSTKTSMDKADSGLTYNINPAPSRKRTRDSINNDFDAFTQKKKASGFVDEDFISHFHQQQSEIDHCIAQHAEKVRLEIEERRKRQSRMLLLALQEGIIKKLKEKDEEIQRTCKLNYVLQERVKNLYVENQMWRDLAQSNEATANTLRNNLEQVLAHVSEDRHVTGFNVTDDAESSCGSCGSGEEDERIGCTLAESAQDKTVAVGRGCRRCGERESSVLVLPCRHLCLCTVCGSNLLGSCPVCYSAMDASLHVNMQDFMGS